LLPPLKVALHNSISLSRFSFSLPQISVSLSLSLCFSVRQHLFVCLWAASNKLQTFISSAAAAANKEIVKKETKLDRVKRHDFISSFKPAGGQPGRRRHDTAKFNKNSNN
jgi:hypothetical protein